MHAERHLPYGWDIKPMKKFEDMDFHAPSENLVKKLMVHVNNDDPDFFRVQVAFYLCMLASTMRCSVKQVDGSTIPVNMYAINLAPSGAGKGKSMKFIKDRVIKQFESNFSMHTWPVMAQRNLPVLAHKIAQRNGTDPDRELASMEREFSGMGAPLLTFDSGTVPAIKQARDKILMANSGSLSLIMDEVGANFTENMPLLETYLELFDNGHVGQKLIKSTKESARYEVFNGPTPANMLLFGVPIKVLDGGKTEDGFVDYMFQGGARRPFFAYGKAHVREKNQDGEKIYEAMLEQASDTTIEDMCDWLGDLADPANMHREITMPKHVAMIFINYRIACENLSEKLGEHHELRKNEISHRYFKAMKLAGAYAFYDAAPEMMEEHAYAAIKLAEESGKAFKEILSRDRNYVKLAKYMAEVDRPVTQADLVEDLPFYKGSNANRQEMLQLATAYGYQNNILIKKAYEEGIEFIRGETLNNLDLDKIIISYSKDMALGYAPDTCKFEQLHKLTQAEGMHWCNHHLDGGHRQEKNAIPGFNIVVLDVDGGTNISTAKLMLKDYHALFHTTKSHTDLDNRFRIIMPINYELALDDKDYKEFMKNLYSWLPFEVDTATGQRARKWLSNPGQHFYQAGEILDVLPFIPKTSKNETFKATVLDQRGMDNLERWFVNNTGDGNRNNMLLKFAMILVDGGFDFDSVLSRVNSLNEKLPDKLLEEEILTTIMVSAGKAISAR